AFGQPDSDPTAGRSFDAPLHDRARLRSDDRVTPVENQQRTQLRELGGERLQAALPALELQTDRLDRRRSRAIQTAAISSQARAQIEIAEPGLQCAQLAAVAIQTRTHGLPHAFHVAIDTLQAAINRAVEQRSGTVDTLLMQPPGYHCQRVAQALRHLVAL